ncbi:hypothetical protein Ais01nite_08690 [Asanoa ishikariensis]|uniref:Uncharacterized protein n=1 Tax=Asanoa ishikariensis TaxID=137265 RepID=A0A1H3T975_9ACTN|nr:hypothetical protein [Asanoa ishikariensis]GIF62834.1 hypothetical protein Ais01nite_08690 [Asanoa ishikariensis]SDZ46784.1 hypothetical protein SAMN05421684_5364 [Asanoa ishikariensis]
MWASRGQAFDAMARGLLADLCFLDEREADQDAVELVLRSYGKLGVAGPFIAMFGKDRSCVAEVASVFAEQFHRLGYLQVARLLDADEWDQLNADLLRRFDGKDVRRSEVEACYGSPSLVIEKRVLCYARADGPGWLFFDCFEDHGTGEYVPGAGRYEWRWTEDPLVRAVRRPAPDFEAGLVLTLYGKVMRWGPGWWLDQPDGLSDEQQAVAAQLRAVEASDPSQSLRTREDDLLR